MNKTDLKLIKITNADLTKTFSQIEKANALICQTPFDDVHEDYISFQVSVKNHAFVELVSYVSVVKKLRLVPDKFARGVKQLAEHIYDHNEYHDLRDKGVVDKERDRITSFLNALYDHGELATIKDK